MANTIQTNYMSLVLPVPTQQLGPQWALDINNAFGTVDQHNHTPGNGQLVPSAGLNINADLSFQQNNALALRSAQLYNNPSPLALPGDVTCLYSSGGNLYYNNALGQQIKLTSGSAINIASAGTIGGDYGQSGVPAIVDYFLSPNNTYYFYQNTNQYAPIAVGPVTISGTTVSANGVTISAPSGLSAPYNLTLPSALPGSTSFTTIDSSGNIAASISTSGGITGSMIGSNTITQSNMAAFTGQQISASCGVFGTGVTADVTNLNVTITTKGGPVVIGLISDGSGNPSFIGVIGTLGTCGLLLYRNGSTELAYYKYATPTNSSDSGNYPAPSVLAIDVPTAGTYTYKVTISTSATTNLYYYQLYAYEL